MAAQSTAVPLAHTYQSAAISEIVKRISLM